MEAGLITIGDELLIGQTINTNLAWLGEHLGNAGISIQKSSTIKDDKDSIQTTLDEMLNLVDLVIITGGLGPTSDDITKDSLVDYFNTELLLQEDILEGIKERFRKQRKEMPLSNIKQAMLPKNATILNNEIGTAPGMWFEKEKKIIISLPGVPYEMKSIVTKEVLPSLELKFKLKGQYHETLMIQGLGESLLSEMIQEWEKKINQAKLNLAYLPSPGIIKLRLTSKRGKQDAPKINCYLQELENQFPEYVYGRNNVSIHKVVGDLLQHKQLTLATVESCTGGGIAHSFIQNSGASSYFVGGIITYSNTIKANVSHVPQELLEKYGAVSKEVAKAMALGGQKELQADYVIAVTGIAGPKGGTKEKPVGTVWVAIASSKKVISKQFLFGSHRIRNLEKTNLYATNMLRRLLLGLDNS